MHALIIEDDDLIAMTIEEVLRKCGFTSFHFAVSLDEAVAAARERCPPINHGRCGVEARFGDRRGADYLLGQSDTRHLHHRASGRGSVANASAPSSEQTFPRERS